MFNGMFAFALYDIKKKILLLARDQLGQKPLYYTKHKDSFLFASEIKSLLRYPELPRVIEQKALNAYLSLGYVPPPSTMFEGIYKVEPASFLIYKNGQLSTNTYWENKHPDEMLDGDSDVLVAEVRERFINSVESRMMSDVPLGTLLSGGIDSTIVTGVLANILNKKIDTFTIGFNEPSFNEEQSKKFNVDQYHARIAAKEFNTNHYEYEVSDNDDLVSLWKKTIYHLDEPCYAPQLLPVFLLTQFARKNITVALSGDGGDELFGGYDMFKYDKLVSHYRVLPETVRTAIWSFVSQFDNVPKKIIALLKRANINNPVERYLSWQSVFDSQQVSGLRKDQLPAKTIIEELFALLNCYFPPDLPKDFLPYFLLAELNLWIRNHSCNVYDKISMASSLELRAPLLDHELVEFASKIPNNYKLKGATNKWILKQAFNDILPKKCIKRPPWGMLSPSSYWLKNRLKPFVQDVLSEKRVLNAGILDPQIVNDWLSGHLSKRRYSMIQVWSLVSLQLWHEMYIQERF